MAQAITITIPHRLTREEARRRVEEEVGRAREQLASLSATAQHSWSGDTLGFTVLAAGQSVAGRAHVEDSQVRVEVDLPWLLAALAGPVRRAVEARGRVLLEARPGPTAGA